MKNTFTVQPTALKPSLVKTTEFELERYWLTYADWNVVVQKNRKYLCKKLNILHYVLRTMTQQKLQM